MFEKRLKKERIKKGLNQPELAHALKVAKQTISNWENGNRTPDSNMLVKIANFFNVSVDYLLGRTEMRDIAIYEKKVKGHDVRIEYDTKVYPDGLTYDQVIDILESLKKAGVNLNPKNRP